MIARPMVARSVVARHVVERRSRSLGMLKAFLALLCLCLGLTAAQAVELDFEALDALDPTEQHRQLSLMLLVSAGVDDDLYAQFAAAAGREGTTSTSAAGTFDPDTYTSPLARIVDQATLLAGAERLFHFTRNNRAAIRSRLDALEQAPDGAGARSGLERISTETILVRTAIADSLAAAAPGEAFDAAERRYREQTVVLRNTLEYAQFQAELDLLTDQAIASVGGKLDAYQRMFDVETNTGVLDRRIRSAELIYLPEGQFDPRAGELTEEMLQNMVLMESQPNR